MLTAQPLDDGCAASGSTRGARVAVDDRSTHGSTAGPAAARTWADATTRETREPRESERELNSCYYGEDERDGECERMPDDRAAYAWSAYYG